MFTIKQLSQHLSNDMRIAHYKLFVLYYIVQALLLVSVVYLFCQDSICNLPVIDIIPEYLTDSIILELLRPIKHF